jgi:ABC-type bacteriocin/lantibiotic exporter with double-glycine peptidase domain
VIIDKVIVQNSPDALNVLGLFLIVMTLIASASEIGLAALTAAIIRNCLARDIFLKLAVTLPKILAMLVVMAIYSPQLAFASTGLTALACGTYYLLKRGRLVAESSSEPLPLSFRLPLTLIVLFLFWYGASLVLALQLSLGQLIAFSIFNIQFVAFLLSLTAAATRGRKSPEAVEPIR